MNQRRETSNRKFWSGSHLLAHLLCLLLIFSTPVLASGTCNNTYSLPITGISGECATTTTGWVWDSRTLNERDIKYEFEPTGDNGCNELIPPMRNNSRAYNAFLFGSSPREDSGPTQSVGVDPATLRPEALDLEIFPSIAISDQLNLKPSLSYSEDVCMARQGRVHYGAPKEWRNHHGELVMMLAGTFQSKVAINQLEHMGEDSSSTNKLSPEVREIQLFFVNATGQQVNFYPDPNHFPHTASANVDKPNVDHLRYWYSSEGNYRLEDLNHNSSSDHFNFSLKTPQGLIYEFARYKHELDAKRESMALHFRVTRITDRYGNYLAITYKNLNSTADLRPEKVEGFNSSGATALHTMNYGYLPDGRLSSVDLPGYGDASARNTYQFFYPDTGAIHPGMPARHESSSVVPNPITPFLDGTTWRAQIPALATDLEGYGKVMNVIGAIQTRLFLDFDSLGFAPEPMLDYNTMTGTDQLDFAPAGYGIRFQYPLVNPHTEGFFQANTFSRQGKRFQGRYAGNSDMAYRFQIDNYPPNTAQTYPDMLEVNTNQIIGGAFPDGQKLLFDVFPMLKDGDALVWQDSLGQLKNLEIDLESDNTFDPTSYAVKLRGSDVPTGVTNARLVREDNRNRIAEIAFPTAPGSSHKRMLLTYDDQSVNHQEIKQVQIFDVNATHALLLTETTYLYEHALVQAQSQDMAEVLPVPNVNPDQWRNCDPTRTLPNMKIGVDILGRHELTDMMRRKTTRHLKKWRAIGDSVSASDYQALTTHYGGAYRFDLMGRGVYPEDTPLVDLGTCDYMEWGLAAKPFFFTWQINPNGTGTVYDLSPKGLGLEPALAHANRYRRVFKSYQFDNQFKAHFLEENSNNPAFKSFTQFNGSDGFTPFYHYLPSYEVPDPCVSCASSPIMADLADNPVLPTTLAPTMADLFGGAANCFAANWTTFELVPIFNYALDTDASHPTRFQRRWTIKALNGTLPTLPTTPAPSTRYLRLSPVTAINLDPALTNKSDAVERFFRGDLSTCPIWGAQASTLATIDWTYGGRVDLGSVFHYYHDRQKTHKLLPHAQVTAQKLVEFDQNQVPTPSGFAWHASGMIDLEWSNGKSPWIIQATRASNGGYMGLAPTNSAKLAGDTTFQITNLPVSVEEDDVFFHGHFLHTIDSITTINPTTSEITFSPPLRRNLANNEKVAFHRFFRGNFANSEPLSAHGYHGYDAFGNNGFQAIYKKDSITLPDPGIDPEHALVPDFFAATAEPFQISLTNSTHRDNNDTLDWNYFGRVSKQFNGHQLSFVDHVPSTPAEKSGWDIGQWMSWTFPGTPYPWTPTQEVAWFMPKDLTINSLNGFSTDDFENEANPTSHLEDRRQEIRYFAVNDNHAWIDPNSLTHGRPAVSWTVTSKHAYSQIAETEVEAQRFEYDARGRLATLIQGAFRLESGAWASPYGTSTKHDYTGIGGDTLMDLPTKTTANSTQVAWDPDGTSPAGRLNVTSEVIESTSHTTYDTLGRVLTNETEDADGYTFGEVLVTNYPSQTKTITMVKVPGASAAFSTVTTFQDGRGQDLVSLRQRGGVTASAFTQVNDYDHVGRLVRAGFERDASLTSSLDAFAKSASARDGAFTESVFNSRGESFGQVVMRAPEAPEEDPIPNSSRWIYLTQNSDGHLISQQLRQAHHDVLPASGDLPDLKSVAVKTSIQNDHGMIAEVRDDKVLYDSSAVWTKDDIPDENGLIAFLPDLTLTPLAKALYTYDRFENVIQAETGVHAGTSQIRTFEFDQRSRLRLEEHPEMRSDSGSDITAVTYEDHTSFDQPQVIKHGSGRTWTYTYNPAGDVVQMIASTSTDTLTTQYEYRYDTSTSAIRFPNLPVLIRHDEGAQVAYVHDYDDMRGWLTERTLFHEFPRFSGFGYEANLANQSHSQLSSRTDGLSIQFVNDSLGRVKEMTYPAPVTGETDATHLEYGYDDDHEMLTTITDKAFGTPLALVENITYDRMDRLKQATYFQPGSETNIHKVVREPDSLNRISSWQTVWEEDRHTKLDETRGYTYDSMGHMAEIQRRETSNTTFSSLYRYSYDSLGQIKQAWLKPEADQTAETHSFTYDTHGFGNLLEIARPQGANSFTLDAEANQLSQFTYSAYGEQETDTRYGVDFDLDYNPLGRLASYDADPQTTDQTFAAYQYDDAGMRVHTANTDAAAVQEERLYFYDDAGMVLCEWVATENNGAWSSRWDRSYVYLDGNTAFTYGYDKEEGTSVAEGTSLPQPQFLQDGLLTWSETTAPYEIEVLDDTMQPLAHYRGLKSADFNLGQRHNYGKYHVRMKGHGTTWGNWQAVYFLNPNNDDLAGEYNFDYSGSDTSDFRNHTDNLEAIGFTDGKHFDALDMNPGERITLEDPHEFLATGTDASISMWLKLPPLGSGDPPIIRRLLWDYGLISLWVTNHGIVELKRKGAAYQPTSVALPLDTWAHLALVYGDGHTEVYIDGALALNGANIPPIFQHTDMTLGSLSSASGFEGLIDRLKLFNRWLTLSEIQTEATP